MSEKPPNSRTISAVMRALGKRGGQKRVPKGFATLNKTQRREMARKAAAARWSRIRISTESK